MDRIRGSNCSLKAFDTREGGWNISITSSAKILLLMFKIWCRKRTCNAHANGTDIHLFFLYYNKYSRMNFTVRILTSNCRHIRYIPYPLTLYRNSSITGSGTSDSDVHTAPGPRRQNHKHKTSRRTFQRARVSCDPWLMAMALSPATCGPSELNLDAEVGAP